jgi:hypothetical protein
MGLPFGTRCCVLLSTRPHRSADVRSRIGQSLPRSAIVKRTGVFGISLRLPWAPTTMSPTNSSAPRSRGGHAAASTALKRAADLTSDGAVAGRRLATAASEALLAGRGDKAARLADHAAELVTDPAVQAQLDYTRARLEAGPGNRRIAFDLMLRASEAIRSSDPATAAQMLVDAGRLAWIEAEAPMRCDKQGSSGTALPQSTYSRLPSPERVREARHLISRRTHSSFGSPIVITSDRAVPRAAKQAEP